MEILKIRKIYRQAGIFLQIIIFALSAQPLFAQGSYISVVPKSMHISPKELLAVPFKEIIWGDFGMLSEDLNKYKSDPNLDIGFNFEDFGIVDVDKDGLPDNFEKALGTNPKLRDSDKDKFDDKFELENGYSPIGKNKLKTDKNIVKKYRGKVLLPLYAKKLKSQKAVDNAGFFFSHPDGKLYFFQSYNVNNENIYGFLEQASMILLSEKEKKIPPVHVKKGVTLPNDIELRYQLAKKYGYGFVSEFFENDAAIAYAPDLRKSYIIDRNGKELLKGPFRDATATSERGIYLIEKPDDKKYFMKLDGTILSGKGYDWTSGDFKNGFVRVSDSERGMLYMDRTGGVILTSERLETGGGDFYEGTTSVTVKSGDTYTTKYINTKGEFYPTDQYDKVVEQGINGMLIVTKDGKSYLIDSSGKRVPQGGADGIKILGWGDSLGEITYLLIKKNGLWYIANSDGEITSINGYESYQFLETGAMIAKQNGKFFLIDSTGNKKTNGYDSFRTIDAKKRFLELREGDVSSVADATGKIVFTLPANYTIDFVVGAEKPLFSMRAGDSRYFFADASGNITSGPYDDIRYSDAPHGIIAKKGSYLVDKNGKQVSNDAFDGIADGGEGYIIITKQRLDKQKQLYDFSYYFADKKTGKQIIKETFTEAKPFKEGFAVVSKDKGFYYIDTKGNEISKERFSCAESFNNGLALVCSASGGSYDIDYTGRKIFNR